MSDLPAVVVKPVGRKAYGHIGHLPGSRVGPGDHKMNGGQVRILTERARDKHDRVIVQEKLDGSCCAVALIDDTLHPITRSGLPAISSRFEMHRLFAQWVFANEDRFRGVLREGERIVGEWLAQAHGTIYTLEGREPFGVFDIMRDVVRMPFDDFLARVDGVFARPNLLHVGGPLPVAEALKLCEANHWPCDAIEGVVYRVERKGVVDFLGKHVLADKVDGKYLDGDAIWLWRPTA
jgi:hypothetical protein